MERILSDETNSPNAQGTPTGADSQAQAQTPAQQPAGSDQFAGLQKRIDELTARAHDAERRREAEVNELRLMNQQLLMSRMEQQVPQPVAPAVDIDPERRKEIDAVMAPLIAQQQRQYAALVFQTGQAQLAAVTSGQHPEVARRTQAIWADAVAKGAHLNGFTPQQALTWARGELVDVLVADAQKGQQVRQGQQLNAQPQALPAVGSVAPRQNAQQVAEPDLDEDPEKASAFYAQRLGEKSF